VGDLEPLETVGPLGFLSDDIEDLVDELGSFGVMTLGPVVLSCARKSGGMVSVRCPSGRPVDKGDREKRLGGKSQLTPAPD